MGIFKSSTAIFIFSLALAACNSELPQEQQQTVAADPYANDSQVSEEDYWAKENFDLQRAGALLERAESPEEFERYLNDDEYGVNNLDLNGDGYADYISVEEFDDQDDDSRGMSLFARYGPDLIQQIATVFLYRDRPDYRGSRVLLVGDENIYGDNYYYETNWLDRGIEIASYLFGDHDRYVSPYYYDNYPTWYSPYEIVATPTYRTRIVELYPEPVFVYTAAVPAYFSDIEIQSPYRGRKIDKIHAKLAKPTSEQAEFIKNAGPRRQFAKEDRGRRNADRPLAGDKPGRPDPPRSDRGDERGNPARDERGAQRGNPKAGPPADKPERPNERPARADNPGRGQAPAPAKAQGQGQGQGKGGPGKGGDQGKGGGQGKGKKP